ncbi:MAG: arginine--tRNA ligase, partial [Lentisphaeria bacterium]|nr:arginine--tRNA ligase [Lentisphaeria bacterium]
MNLKCLDDLRDHLIAAHPNCKATASFEILWEPCPAGMNGDITVNCFRIARDFASAPDALAEEAKNFLEQHTDVAGVEKIKAFVNVTLNAAGLFRDSVADVKKLMADVALPESETKKILVEYSAPNTNKPQHLGHVRNNTLGMSLVSLLARAGHNMVPVNLVNDRGIHICKSMLAYQRCGNNVLPEEAGIKGDHYVGDFYVKYNNMLSDEIKALKAAKPELADKSSDELFLETEIGREAQEMLRKWEAGDEDVVALWKKMNEWVFKGFAETYTRMGVKFVKTYLESNTYLLGKEVIAENLEKGVFQYREDGAVIADLGKLGQKVLLRKDGTSVYITQDIGTTLLKHSEHDPDSMIWVVGDEQNLHFQMLFKILKMMGAD